MVPEGSKPGERVTVDDHPGEPQATLNTKKSDALTNMLKGETDTGCSLARSVSLLNCEIYQRGRVSRVADTELILVSNRTPHPTTRFNSWCRMS